MYYNFLEKNIEFKDISLFKIKGQFQKYPPKEEDGKWIMYFDPYLVIDQKIEGNNLKITIKNHQDFSKFIIQHDKYRTYYVEDLVSVLRSAKILISI